MIQYSDTTNALVSTGEAGIMVWLMEQVMPWTLHTIGAVLSTAVVAVCIFLLNRWLNNSPWIEKHFPKKK